MKCCIDRARPEWVCKNTDLRYFHDLIDGHLTAICNHHASSHVVAVDLGQAEELTKEEFKVMGVMSS